mmetsp:Transcript_42212/g.92532  ORF Transcript_42212/g.92532 Transcript_42212/m.92532 type:complete len:205 (+) Transcript_42212:186-800(+)
MRGLLLPYRALCSLSSVPLANAWATVNQPIPCYRPALVPLYWRTQRVATSAMSSGSAIPPGSVATLEGDALTAEEMAACKIGGCCGKDTPRLPMDAVHQRIGALPQWQLSDDGKVISREFVARNWAAAIGFINAMSAIAEEEGHHPDVHLTGWRTVRVDLSTHAIGGLSLPDLVLAAKIDTIRIDYSAKWIKELQAQNKPVPKC